MRQNLTLLMFFCSFYGSAQLYVQEGATLTLGSSETFLSSQETLNKIDAPIIGEGTLFFNSTSTQQLISSQDVLELPTLHIQNADLVQIETLLNLQGQLQIVRGELILSHNLVLNSSTALVLGTDASICLSSNGQIVYKTQLEEFDPLALQQTLLIKYTGSKTFQERPETALIVTPTTSNFGSLANSGYVVYFKHSTPPPKAV